MPPCWPEFDPLTFSSNPNELISLLAMSQNRIVVSAQNGIHLSASFTGKTGELRNGCYLVEKVEKIRCTLAIKRNAA